MDLLNTKQAAEYVGLAFQTMSNMRWRGDGPAYVKMGRTVRYRRADLDAWVASQVVSA
ncbi:MULTISPECIES: helix-turn-helix transcriptional regulator [unclassified Gordonia (in: high G+C Gram-positive bacteria)]